MIFCATIVDFFSSLATTRMVPIINGMDGEKAVVDSETSLWSPFGGYEPTDDGASRSDAIGS
jgi:hypothetical protein